MNKLNISSILYLSSLGMFLVFVIFGGLMGTDGYEVFLILLAFAQFGLLVLAKFFRKIERQNKRKAK